MFIPDALQFTRFIECIKDNSDIIIQYKMKTYHISYEIPLQYTSINKLSLYNKVYILSRTYSFKIFLIQRGFSYIPAIIYINNLFVNTLSNNLFLIIQSKIL